MDMPEYIVIGSGCAGAMAAQTLVETGKQVQMVDVGIGNKYEEVIPEKDYLDIRKQEKDQYRYFLGDDAEGLAWGKVGKGEQITPPRKYMLQDVDDVIPVKSDSFFPAESLGYGGLGIGWGVGCWEWSEAELTAAGMDAKDMEQAYNVVASRIGISGVKDTASAYTLNKLKGYQPATKMDRNHTLLYKKYLDKKDSFDKKGFVMGRAPLAVITKDKDGRKKYAYRDMDFYSDKDQSAWRPWITINQLKKKRNFTYTGGLLALNFKEKKDYVEVTCLDVATSKQTKLRGKKLILAASALGSARIVLRSNNDKKTRLPLLCNPYSYVPCIQPAMVGKGTEDHKLGLAQLSLFLDEDHDNMDVSMASIYGYQSLMLFRIVKQVPLNFADAGNVMKYLTPGVIIMGIHQSDKPSDSKYVQLVDDASSPTGDALKATYKATEDEVNERARREKKYISAMRKLNAYALKRIDPGFGSSIHYAGTLPFSDEEKPNTLNKQGKLHGTNNVYVADSAGFTYLPAKGLTFSLLANAHIVARNAANED